MGYGCQLLFSPLKHVEQACHVGMGSWGIYMAMPVYHWFGGQRNLVSKTINLAPFISTKFLYVSFFSS